MPHSLQEPTLTDVISLGRSLDSPNQLMRSSYRQNVSRISVSHKPLALGLLFNPRLLYCEVEKTFLL